MCRSHILGQPGGRSTITPTGNRCPPKASSYPNLVGLGAFVARSGVVGIDVQREVLRKEFGKKGDLLKAALEVFEAGVKAVAEGAQAG
jgi:Pyruvate/2-oxoacid:ferredoxin oxidoreductase gamma subunit